MTVICKLRQLVPAASLLVACYLLSWAPRAFAGEEDAAATSVEKPRIEKSPADEKLAEIIRAVADAEKRYRQLDARLIARRTGEKPVPLREEIHLHFVWQGDLFYFEAREKHLAPTGEPTEGRRVSAYDGERTRSVVYGNCVNIHRGRHPWPQLYLPHCWCLYFGKVHFPLSVYLSGTEAIKASPYSRKGSGEHGTIFEFPRVECSYEGEDTVDGLACAKIRCRRWHYSHDVPTVSLVWLARAKLLVRAGAESGVRVAEGQPRRGFKGGGTARSVSRRMAAVANLAADRSDALGRAG